MKWPQMSIGSQIRPCTITSRRDLIWHPLNTLDQIQHCNTRSWM